MSLKRVALFLALLFGGGALALGLSAYAFGNTKDETAAWVQELKTDAYAPQRVIYHVDEGAGLFNGRFKHVLQVAQNHVNAVGADRLDLRIIMQSEGVDLLRWAKNDAGAQAKIASLKAQGVKFELCRNTLVARGIDPDEQLYDVKKSDIVRAAVGEIAALEQQGFQYIKP